MKSNSSEAGFSILEVLITAAIIGIVTAVMVSRYGAFNNAVLLKSQTFEVALDLREAQLYAISVRGAGGQFREDYGVYFDLATPDRYQTFLDSGETVEYNRNVAYFDEGEAIGPPLFIDSRFVLSRICVNGCSEEVTDLSVSFKRPDFDAQFASASGVAAGVGEINDASIILTNAFDQSASRVVNVNTTGQIMVLGSEAEIPQSPNAPAPEDDPDPEPEPDSDPEPPPAAQTIQAESSGDCDRDASFENNHSGYTGSGFVDFGSWVECNFDFGDYSGPATLSVRYAVGGSARPVYVLVNGSNQGTMDMNGTGDWNDWGTEAESITLSAGNNTIRLQEVTSAGPNVDSMTVTPTN